MTRTSMSWSGCAELREARRFAEADEVRAQLAGKGIVIEETAEGTRGGTPRARTPRNWVPATLARFASPVGHRGGRARR